ncbi:hypothetical protein [Amycolatopsis thermophila]|uniref:Uncharacterized protein n=1 Tax=Amycolatopsis thermophila TaxID=206084 RepID=A0ABU0F6H5_9PSEU|nr:hypothetical protein [Amycolatopsis thermophila]MDQ0383113.1 hypothetical protein [Amycolatopsis thermophila]
MGRSCIEFGDQDLWVADAHIRMWLYLINAEIDRLPAPPAWLARAREDWHREAVAGVHGMILPTTA